MKVPSLRALDSVGVRSLRPWLAVAALVGQSCLFAQDRPAETPPEPAEDDVVELSPFVVDSSEDSGYFASETLAGTRLATDLWKVGSQVTVMTQEFLDDIAATNLDDANLYSLNVENSTEFTGENETSDANSVQFVSGSGETPQRVRGLSNATNSRDFFFTLFRQDNYNTERITYASGPNAILFGLGSPGGVVDQSLKRAHFKDERKLGLRFDSEDSVRVSLDINQRLIKDLLAIRVVLLRDEAKEWRKPSHDLKERLFATITARPFKSTTVRVSYENIADEVALARRILLRDYVTPYLTFREAEMTRLGISDPLDPRLYWAPTNFLAPGETSIARDTTTGLGANNNARPYQITGAFSPETPPANYFGWLQGSAQTINPPITPGGGARSLTDESIYPSDINPMGLVNRTSFDGHILTGVFEQRITKNLFIEAALNHEEVTQETWDWVRGNDFNLRMDVNRYIPNYTGTDGRPVLNPNRGRFYIESNGRWLRRLNETDAGRVTASYVLDFREQESFLKWFGRHKIAGLLDFEKRDERTDNGRTQVYENGGTVRVGSDRNGRLLFHRFYFDTPASEGRAYADDEQDVFGLVNQSYGTATGVTVYPFDPEGVKGQQTAGQSSLRETNGRMIAIQSDFLDERILVTYGKRWDNFKSKREQNQQIGGTEWYRVNYPSILEYDRADLDDSPDIDAKGTNTTKGIVLFPFSFLSIHYNQSTNQSAAAGFVNPNGGLSPATSGDGEDYGFGLRLMNGRIYLRANYYKTAQVNSPLDTTLAVRVSGVENLVEDLGLLYPTVGFQPTTTWNHEAEFSQTRTLADVVSEGYEFTLVANPTASWRLSISAAKTESVQTNKGDDFERYVADRLPEWSKFADYGRNSLSPVAEPDEETVEEFYQRTVFTEQIEINNLLDGQSNIRVPKWRVNVVTSYDFKRGPLKNFAIGGAFRWRDQAAIGFPTITAPNGSTIQDINNPHLNDGSENYDGWMSYRTTFFKRKIKARFQLNVRNLLDDQDLIPLRADAAGNRYVFQPAKPRLFILSADFTF